MEHYRIENQVIEKREFLVKCTCDICGNIWDIHRSDYFITFDNSWVSNGERLGEKKSFHICLKCMRLKVVPFGNFTGLPMEIKTDGGGSWIEIDGNRKKIINDSENAPAGKGSGK